MAIEKTQIKFAKSEQTGELIGFVSYNDRTNKLRGVREDSRFGKRICVLSEELKGTIIPNRLYSVELKAMHNSNGYVVISASQALFQAVVETCIIPKIAYQVKITFGNKVIYFDPINGGSASSRTRQGVVEILVKRQDIDNIEEILSEFYNQAATLVRRLEKDGYLLSPKC